MSSSHPRLPVILYHYPYSSYARRVVWYLRLRGISYLECIQPPTLPRPDLSTHLAVSYRRIPVLSIGRDLYLDTRLILRKLETAALGDGDGDGDEDVRARGGPLGAARGTDALALQRLLSALTTSTDLFFRAAALLPVSLPLLRDAKFRRDREDFFNNKGDGAGRRSDGPSSTAAAVATTSVGGDEQQQQQEEEEVTEEEEEEDEDEDEEQQATRAEALREIRSAMALLEDTLLADGREWVLGSGSSSGGPTLADIEAVWVFHWLIGLPGNALFDAGYVSRDRFPLVYAWVERFQGAVGRAKGTVKVRRVTGEEAAAVLKGGDGGGGGYFEPETPVVDGADPIVKVYGFETGSRVEVWPTDSGCGHRDRGRLVGIGPEEVVWETDAGVRVHAPRQGFRVRPVVGPPERGPCL